MVTRSDCASRDNDGIPSPREQKQDEKNNQYGFNVLSHL